MLIGLPGIGKTIMAMQFLNEGLIHGEKCLFISLATVHKKDPEDTGPAFIDPKSAISAKERSTSVSAFMKI